mmetsp:Transcript_52869/g.112858  ORF Transcript_52869/g.112858 Transcript_52869/m.112858 type:complete len:735 (+) Transcript_52869:75-2279(+)
MKFARGLALLCAASLPDALEAAVATSEAGMNPIRKVVTLLQDMQKKVTEEGEKDKELYEKFECYCKSGTSDLTASISSAETAGVETSADVKTAKEKKTLTEEELKTAQDDRVAAKAAIEEATALREKEAATYSAEESEYKTNIAAITKAVAALEKGMTGFLQTHTASVVRKIVTDNKDMDESERELLLSFLSSDEQSQSQYSPQSGEVVGILKQLKDEMSKTLADLTGEEDSSIKNYDALMEAKKKEIAALSAAIETKLAKVGELGVTIANLENEAGDAAASLAADQEYLAELEKSCGTKASEWEERQKLRAEELVALSETIKVLNDDDALDLFKKTLPSPDTSLMQLTSATSSQRTAALNAIRVAQRHVPREQRTSLDLLALSLSGKGSTKGFEKVIKMCDDMVEMLKKEQVDDDNKKEYCNTQLDMTEDKLKALDRAISDEEAAIASAEEGLAALGEELKALEAGIKSLDKSVGEATEQRKAENVEYKELMASDSAAKQLLEFAKNRLNKFYNPKLYKPPAEQELSAEDQIFVNNGGTPPPTEAPGGIAGTGVTAFVQIKQHSTLKDAPAPPPATWSAYQSKSEEHNGVTAMMDLLIKDLDKEMTEAETEEKEAQKDYEALMADAASKRASDTSSLTEKTSAKAELESVLERRKEAKKDATSELMAVQKYMASVHAECSWLLQYFDVRKAARSDEIDSLKRAKAVLSGADYSLVQMHSSAASSSGGFLSRRQ